MDADIDKRFDEAEERILDVERLLGEALSSIDSAKGEYTAAEKLATGFLGYAELIELLVMRDHERDPSFWQAWLRQRTQDLPTTEIQSGERAQLRLQLRLVSEALDRADRDPQRRDDARPEAPPAD